MMKREVSLRELRKLVQAGLLKLKYQRNLIASGPQAENPQIIKLIATTDGRIQTLEAVRDYIDRNPVLIDITCK